MENGISINADGSYSRKSHLGKKINNQLDTLESVKDDVWADYQDYDFEVTELSERPARSFNEEKSLVSKRNAYFLATLLFIGSSYIFFNYYWISSIYNFNNLIQDSRYFLSFSAYMDTGNEPMIYVPVLVLFIGFVVSGVYLKLRLNSINKKVENLAYSGTNCPPIVTLENLNDYSFEQEDRNVIDKSEKEFTDKGEISENID